MDQICAARKSARASMVINEVVKRNAEISSRQDSSVSTTEPDDEDKKDSKQDSYHLWIMT